MGNADNLSVGDRFGDWMVVEKRADLLRLATPQQVPRFMVAAGVVCLMGGVALMLAAAQAFPQRSVFENWGVWSGGLVILGIAMAVVGFGELGLAYEFDGNSRAILKRRIVVVGRWSAEAFESVNVSVTQHGPDEILRLTLVSRAVGGNLVIGQAPSDRRGLSLIQATAQIARILKLPATRYGKPAPPGGSTMTVNNALNEFQPIEGSGDGRDLIINCPYCGTRGARAVAYDLIETYKHVLKHRTTWVKCSSCGRQLYSKVPADQLRGRTAEQLEGIVIKRTSLIHIILAIGALAMCLLPIFGVVTAIVALLFNWRNRGWLRVLSLVALVISVLLTTAFLILSQIFPSDEERRAHSHPTAPPPSMVQMI